MGKTQTRDERMDEVMHSINEVNDYLPTINTLFLPRLKELREKGYRIEYVALGTQVIEFLLSRLMMDFDFTINDLLKIIEQQSESKLELEVKLNQRSNATLGEIIQLFIDRKLIEEDQLIITLLKELNSKRKGVIHNLIVDYHGDAKKANEDYKNFTDRMPIETIFHEIIQIHNILVLELEKRRKSLGLVPKDEVVSEQKTEIKKG